MISLCTNVKNNNWWYQSSMQEITSIIQTNVFFGLCDYWPKQHHCLRSHCSIWWMFMTLDCIKLLAIFLWTLINSLIKSFFCNQLYRLKSLKATYMQKTMSFMKFEEWFWYSFLILEVASSFTSLSHILTLSIKGIK